MLLRQNLAMDINFHYKIVIKKKFFNGLKITLLEKKIVAFSCS